MFARFDEIPSLPFEDIKETKRHGLTHGQRENSIPAQKHSLQGYNKRCMTFARVAIYCFLCNCVSPSGWTKNIFIISVPADIRDQLHHDVKTSHFENRLNVARGPNLHDWVLSFLLLSRLDSGSITFCTHDVGY